MTASSTVDDTSMGIKLDLLGSNGIRLLCTLLGTPVRILLDKALVRGVDYTGKLTTGGTSGG
jgi:hypothetical protein